MELLTISDFRAKGAPELIDGLTSLKKDLLNLRFEQASGQLRDTSRVKKVKKAVARIKTVLSQSKSAV